MPSFWSKITKLSKRVTPGFQNLDYDQLPRGLRNGLTNKIYYTPKIQRFAYTEELAKYIRFLNRKDTLSATDMRAFTEAVLTEYGAVNRSQQIPEQVGKMEYSITRKFTFTPNELSPFSGEVDYMVWLNKKHFVPVLFFERDLNPIAGAALAHAAKSLRCIARNNYINSGHSILTNGQDWQMFKVYSNQNTQKTSFYTGRNRFKNILQDPEMIEAVFGIIDQSLQTKRQNVDILKLAYDIIDQKKYMIEAKNKQEAQKGSFVSKLLLKYYKKRDQSTSK